MDSDTYKVGEMVNLKRIRIDNQGLLVQNQNGWLKRIGLQPEDLRAMEQNPLEQLEALIRYKKELRDMLSQTELRDTRIDIIDEPADGLNRPLSVYYGIEPRCNLSCKMCGPRDFHEGFRPASEEKEEFLLEEIIKAGTFQVQLTGGEISVRGSRLVKTVERLSEAGIAVILSTNGVWNRIQDKDRFIGQLADCGNVIQTKISIDGTQRFHESLRGKGTYEQTVDTLDKLAKHDLHPRISTTIFRSSANLEELEHLVQLASRYCAGFQPIPLRTTGMACTMKDETPTKEQIIRYTKHATRLRKETRIPITFNFDIYSEGRQVPVYDLQHPISCNAPLTAPQITHTGEVYPCGFVQDSGSGRSFLAGIVSHEHSLVDIWLNSELLKEIRSAGKSEDCQRCGDYGKGCWGGCWVMGYIDTGRINGKDPYCPK